MNKAVTLFKVLRKCRKNTDADASGSIFAGNVLFLAVIGILLVIIQSVVALIFSKMMYSKGVKVLKHLTE